MNYTSSLDFLYQALPMFQRVGASAFKKDLSNTLKLCEHLGNPQHKFKSIHIAGTNGKGSTAHALASVLQEAGYSTGLYTSPHLKSFRERIKINGTELPEKEVVAFVEANKDFLLDLKPSFFEMTVALSFNYFARMKVDYAIIETGMGGRFDSTNVIHPLLSIITNIGFDHEQFLGDSLDKIAFEKAGIIKQNVPVVIGTTQEITMKVFREKALEKNAAIYFADQLIRVNEKEPTKNQQGERRAVYEISGAEAISGEIKMDLMGSYQARNLPAIIMALGLLKDKSLQIDPVHVYDGLEHIVKNTGLKGRWQILSDSPLTICDTGHNTDGIDHIVQQLKSLNYQKLYMVFGMVKDKDYEKIFNRLPKEAIYIFCQADQPRAMPAETLQQLAAGFGINGTVVYDVNAAIAAAKKIASADDVIFIGGSTFVVAEINEL